MADSTAKNPFCSECGAALSRQDSRLSMCRSCRSRNLEAALRASGDSPDPRMSDFLNHCYKAFYLAYHLGNELSKEIAASTTVAGPHQILATRAGLKKNLEKQLSCVPRDTVCGASEDFCHVRELLSLIERIMTQLTGWKLGKLSLDSLSLLATEFVDHGGRGVDAVSELSSKYPVNNAYEEAWPTTNADASTVSAVKSGKALDSPTGFLGGAELADALGIHATRRDAFSRQLSRKRKSLEDFGWHEVREPRPHSPRFLYRPDFPKLRDLAAVYTKPKPA